MAASIETPPRVFLLDGAFLVGARQRVYDGDPGLAAADQRLLLDAEAAGTVGPFTVVGKATVPPSGDVRDYVSQSPCWWPDPDTEDGLPWIRRDGEANPECDLHDHHAMAAMISAVNTLSAAFFFSDLEHFAEQAGLLLRTWFLDPATRMNPHLQFARGIPGRCDGHGNGIIDTAPIGFLLDSVGLLGESTAWTADDQQGLVDWMSQLLTWLLDSAHGRDEASQANIHGTWYDTQVLSLALFTGSAAVAQATASKATQRLDRQIDADGAQPRERARTRSLDYAVMNLTGLFDLADVSAHCGVDLWQHVGGEGQSLRRALDWLVAHALESVWLRPQIEPFDTRRWLPVLWRAAHRFGDPTYRERISRLPGMEETAADRSNLLYPDIGS